MKFKKRSEGADNSDMPKAENTPVSEKKRREAVVVYVVILFTAALCLILLSYFIQQRRNADTIDNLTEEHGKFSTQALANIEELQTRNLELTEKNEKLESENRQLQEELEETKEKWAEDVKNVEDTLKTDVNEGIIRESALKSMYLARMALVEGDIETAKTEAEKAKLSAEFLDDDWSKTLEDLISDITAAEETEND